MHWIVKQVLLNKKKCNILDHSSSIRVLHIVHQIASVLHKHQVNIAPNFLEGENLIFITMLPRKMLIWCNRIYIYIHTHTPHTCFRNNFEITKFYIPIYNIVYSQYTFSLLWISKNTSNFFKFWNILFCEFFV